jgi:cytochrome c553
LKAPSNLLCLSCHDGQTFAPDVLGFNANASPIQGRNAGALNDTAGASPYQTWKGHTLDSTAVAPGFNPTVIGAPATWYDPTAGLTCISCHAHHGPVAAYRNLGPTALGSAITDARPTYIISSTNDTLRDVWINLPSYIAGSGSATTFNPFYATVYINYNRNDATVNITRTSNRVDTFCAACHGNFHGGPGDTNIGGTGTPAIGFLRHPTSQATIGFATGGAHSVLSLYVAATSKVKVYTNDYAAYSSSSPGCVSCHKAHGNQNPFGLIFLSRAEANPNEEGSTVTDFTVGYRNLCGQCHP